MGQWIFFNRLKPCWAHIEYNHECSIHSVQWFRSVYKSNKQTHTQIHYSLIINRMITSIIIIVIIIITSLVLALWLGWLARDLRVLSLSPVGC